MWPSEDWASTLYSWANWGLIAGLVVGVVSTILIVWMGNIKEAYLRSELANTGERAAKIENDNLTLRSDLNAETGKVAGLQKDAVEAKTVQQRVETELSKQQERAANAEKELLRLQASLADRTISPQQQGALTVRMKPWAALEIDVLIWGDTAEIQLISSKILKPLTDAGLQIHAGQAGGGGAVRGILVGVRSDADAHIMLAANELVSALQSFGLGSGLWDFNNMSPPSIIFNSAYTGKAPIRLFIGSKPSN